jgi:hypothetical protein
MRLEEQTAHLLLYRNGAHAWLPEPANKQGHTHKGHAGGGARPRAEHVIWAQGSRSMWVRSGRAAVMGSQLPHRASREVVACAQSARVLLSALSFGFVRVHGRVVRALAHGPNAAAAARWIVLYIRRGVPRAGWWMISPGA